MLAKAIYVRLFGWLIEQLNAAMAAGATVPLDENSERFVGLLDIFGFENFAFNSFEQLCINFTNEKLQNHFMDALVKLRQEEYAREGVACDHITFPDNRHRSSIA
jgi:myosin-5